MWKPWMEHYEVSNDGRIRHTGTGTIRKPQYVGRHREYPNVSIYLHGKRYRRMIHTAVLEAFVGPRPQGMEARHLNDDKQDNRVENLVWGTRVENVQDAIHNGRFLTGSRASWTKLTEDQVREILASSETQQALADRFGVARPTIANIKQRRNWKWVTV